MKFTGAKIGATDGGFVMSWIGNEPTVDAGGHDGMAAGGTTAVIVVLSTTTTFEQATPAIVSAGRLQFACAGKLTPVSVRSVPPVSMPEGAGVPAGQVLPDATTLVMTGSSYTSVACAVRCPSRLITSTRTFPEQKGGAVTVTVVAEGPVVLHAPIAAKADGGGEMSNTPVGGGGVNRTMAPWRKSTPEIVTVAPSAGTCDGVIDVIVGVRPRQ